MSEGPQDTGRRHLRRMLVITAGAVVLAGLVVAGVFAAAGTGPARANLPAPTATAADAGARTADADPAPRAARPTGTGAPIRISGTDPVTGRRVDLAAFTGKPVVLAIWASWCPGCNDEAPHLATVARSRTDVHFVGLNYRDSRDGARGFTERYGWTFPSIGDPDGELAFRLGLQGTPTTLFLDSEHREIGRIVGATDAAGFSEAVDRITAS